MVQKILKVLLVAVMVVVMAIGVVDEVKAETFYDDCINEYDLIVSEPEKEILFEETIATGIDSETTIEITKYSVQKYCKTFGDEYIWKTVSKYEYNVWIKIRKDQCYNIITLESNDPIDLTTLKMMCSSNQNCQIRLYGDVAILKYDVTTKTIEAYKAKDTDFMLGYISNTEYLNLIAKIQKAINN